MVLAHGGRFNKESWAPQARELKGAGYRVLAIDFRGYPERLTVRKLYVMARDDTSGAGPRLPALRAHFKRAPEPKELLILDGSAHAQFIFETEQGGRLTREILRFLSAP